MSLKKLILLKNIWNNFANDLSRITLYKNLELCLQVLHLTNIMSVICKDCTFSLFLYFYIPFFLYFKALS